MVEIVFLIPPSDRRRSVFLPGKNRAPAAGAHRRVHLVLSVLVGRPAWPRIFPIILR
jgi:hypothetical protein